MTALPLLRHFDDGAAVAFRNGEAVTAGQFLADAHALASALPDRGYVVNRISDRYRFAVAFAAALLRRQIMLLPADSAVETMRRLAIQHPDAYGIADEPVSGAEMPYLKFPALDQSGSSFPVPEFDERQVAALMFTSGTTADPVASPRTWGTLVRSTVAAGASFGIQQFSRAAVLATVLPQHSYGLESGVMLPLQHGLAMTALPAFYPADILQQLASLPRPRILVTTPIHLRFLVAESGIAPAVDLIVSATAPLAEQLASEAEARFSAKLIEIYGFTEAGQIAYRRTTGGREWHLLNGFALEQDRDTTWATGDAIENRNVPLNDVVELRAAHRFILLGRKGDLVNIAGKRTSLAHLNHHLNAIPGVKDGVFINPDSADESGSRLMAFAVAPGLGADEIKRALRERIDSVFLPRPLFLVDELPRNPNGKLTRGDIDALRAATRKDGVRHGEIAFPVDLPSAAGHFPGDPIVPGATLLDEIVALLQEKTDNFHEGCEIRAGKFLAPVRPGDRMAVSWTKDDDGNIRFKCSVDDNPVLSGVIGGMTQCE